MRMCASSAAASQAARPRCTSRSAAIGSCCSKARRIGWGASGRSGGQAIAGFASGQHKLERQVGPENARRMWDISVEGLQLISDRVARHAIDCDLHWGQMHVAIKPRQRAALLEEQRDAESATAIDSCRFLERAEIEALLATKRYCAGLYDSGGGHLHPLNYTLGLAAAARAAGVQIYEHSLATRLTRGDPARRRHRRGQRQREVRRAVLQRLCNRSRAVAARSHHAGRHVHHRDRVARRRAHQAL